MSSRASASARFGPTPLRYFTEVTSCSITPLPPSPFPGLSPAYQALGVGLRVEHLKVFEPLPGTDETDRDRYRALDCDDAAALRGAVELGDDQAGERQPRGERPRLLDGVLAHRAVQHEQRLVRGAGPLLRDHAHDFLELLEQPLLGVHAARRVHEYRVDPTGAGRRDRVERHGRRVGPSRATDTRDGEPVRPDLELLARPSPERVGGAAAVRRRATACCSAAWKSPSRTGARVTWSRISAVAATPKSASSMMRSASSRAPASRRPNTRATRSHSFMAVPVGGATPTRSRTPRSQRRTATAARAAERSRAVPRRRPPERAALALPDATRRSTSPPPRRPAPRRSATRTNTRPAAAITPHAPLHRSGACPFGWSRQRSASLSRRAASQRQPSATPRASRWTPRASPERTSPLSLLPHPAASPPALRRALDTPPRSHRRGTPSETALPRRRSPAGHCPPPHPARTARSRGAGCHAARGAR